MDLLEKPLIIASLLEKSIVPCGALFVHTAFSWVKQILFTFSKFLQLRIIQRLFQSNAKRLECLHSFPSSLNSYFRLSDRVKVSKKQRHWGITPHMKGCQEKAVVRGSCEHFCTVCISGPIFIFQLITYVLSEFCFVTAKINSIPLGSAPEAVKFTLQASNALVHTVSKFVFSQQTNFHTKCIQIGHQGEG